jgi:hypothetical protein
VYVYWITVPTQTASCIVYRVSLHTNASSRQLGLKFGRHGTEVKCSFDGTTCHLCWEQDPMASRRSNASCWRLRVGGETEAADRRIIRGGQRRGSLRVVRRGRDSPVPPHGGFRQKDHQLSLSLSLSLTHSLSLSLWRPRVIASSRMPPAETDRLQLGPPDACDTRWTCRSNCTRKLSHTRLLV